MSNVLKMMSRGGTAAAETDPNFKQTVLLLHGDGTNGAQNNTFLDGSTNNFTITRNGNTTQGTFSPFSVGAGEWSNSFGSTTGYLSISTSTALDISTGSFTIEMWVYPSSGTYLQMAARRSAQTARGFILYYDFSTKQFVFLAGDTNTTAWEVSLTSASTYNANQWAHVAVTRDSSNNFTLWVNGTSQATGNSSVTIADASSNLLINAADGITYGNGYYSNWRLVKGRAVYTSAFTPSTAPLGTTTGGQNPPQGTETSLLTCQSNRFVDNSLSPNTITRNGDVRVTPLSPFAPSAAYDPAVNGGSGYFDGTGDWLTAPNNTAFDFGTGDFTIECWVYPSNNAGTGIFERRIFPSGNVFIWYLFATTLVPTFFNGTNYSSSIAAIPNSWNHIVLSRESGTLRQFVNGQLGFSQTITTNLSVSNVVTLFGSNDAKQYLGYAAEMRVVKGRAVYTSAYTPPTALLGTTTGGQNPPQGTETSLLLNFTNAGIFDNTGKNNLETVGNAQIDTTTKKYGTGSMEFDGTTDYVVQPTSENYGYGTGDFTIEFWLYLNSTGLQTIVSNLVGATTTQPHLYISTTIRYYTTSADRITGASLSTGQWYHIALVRASGSTRLYIDGTQSGSTYTDTNNYGATAPLGIGTYWNAGAPVTTSTLNGYIDDLRITKGVARYPTEPFPTKAFPDL